MFWEIPGKLWFEGQFKAETFVTLFFIIGCMFELKTATAIKETSFPRILWKSNKQSD